MFFVPSIVLIPLVLGLDANVRTRKRCRSREEPSSTTESDPPGYDFA